MNLSHMNVVCFANIVPAAKDELSFGLRILERHGNLRRSRNGEEYEKIVVGICGMCLLPAGMSGSDAGVCG